MPIYNMWRARCWDCGAKSRELIWSVAQKLRAVCPSKETPPNACTLRPMASCWAGCPRVCRLRQTPCRWSFRRRNLDTIYNTGIDYGIMKHGYSAQDYRRDTRSEERRVGKSVDL